MKVSEGTISHLGYINLPVNLYKEWASTPLPALFKLFSCHTSTSWPSGQLNLLTEDQSLQKEMGSWLLRMGNWGGWPPFPPTLHLGSTGNDPGVYWCGAWCCLFFSIPSLSDPTIEYCFILPVLIELANYEESKTREDGGTCPFRWHGINPVWGISASFLPYSSIGQLRRK